MLANSDPRETTELEVPTSPVDEAVLLNQYQSLSDEQVPKFNRKTDRVDHFWSEVFNELANINDQRPVELEK